MLKLEIQQVIIKVMLPRQPVSTISCEELNNILPSHEYIYTHTHFQKGFLEKDI